MIARLTGTLAETSADGAVVDVGGIGYQILASARTLDALGPIGGEVLILTELQVREDGWTLFGFGSAGERETFRILTSVQGVGGRVALAILSAFTPDELARAVSTGDKAMIARAQGVGPKLAARIANELQGKLGEPALPARPARLCRAPVPPPMLCPRSPTSASSPPKPAPPSPPPTRSSVRTRRSMRWCGWR
jgi:holliday junction DNA helicase RuvA